MLVGSGIKLLGAQKQRLGRQHRALRVALDQAVPFACVLPKMGKSRLELAVQYQGGIGAEVVKHAGGFVKKQRQVVLNASGGHAVSDVFVNAASGRVALKQLAPAAAKPGSGRFVHRELSPGQQPNRGHRVEAALAVRVEGADAVDLVVKQIDPQGHQAAHGKQVNQPAAHRVFTRADHLGDMAVAGQRQLGLEPGFIELLFDLELKGVAGQKCRWRQPVKGGGRRHDHQVGAGLTVALVDAPQRGETLADEILVR